MASVGTNSERVPLLNDDTEQTTEDRRSSLNNGNADTAFTSSWLLFGLRFLLRITSLWCPRSSCFVIKYVYPLLVNLFLLIVTIFAAVPAVKSGSSDLLLYFTICLGAYFGNVAGLLYFRSYDALNNLTNLRLKGPLQNAFRKQLIRYNARLVYYTVILCVGSFVGKNESRLFIYQVMNVVAHCFTLGMYLALLLIVDLLELTSRIRLDDQYSKFLTWAQSTEEAINHHIVSYSNKVDLSCDRLRWWFSVHNGFLTVMLPSYIFFHSIKDTAFSPLPAVFLLFVIWALPLHFARKMRRNEEEFCCKMNKICLSSLTIETNETTTVEIEGVPDSNGGEETHRTLTFASRSEVNKFVAYLQNTKSGFIAFGYDFQLRLSQIRGDAEDMKSSWSNPRLRQRASLTNILKMECC